MSDKERVSASVDSPIASYLQQDAVNASGLINKLVKQYINGNGGADQMLQLRIDQVENELESLENRVSQKRTQLENLRSRRESEQNQKEQQLDRAVEALDRSDLYAGNQTVQYWANELGMTEDEFLTTMQERM